MTAVPIKIWLMTAYLFIGRCNRCTIADGLYQVKLTAVAQREEIPDRAQFYRRQRYRCPVTELR